VSSNSNSNTNSNSDGDSDGGSDSGPGTREVAQRLLAAEFDDATYSYSESDEERAPNYVVSPTGARINRMFAVGVLTEVESVNEDIVRGRVVDATGPFVTYAGQYQPDEQAYLERTTPPEFVALTGKARTFEPEDGDRIYSSVRPESLNSVDADTRDRWIVTTAESTLYRVAVMRDALDSELRGEDLRRALDDAGVPTSLATGIPRAVDHYGTTTAYLEAVRRLAVDALEVVAGERDEARSLDLAPGEGGDADLGALPAGVDLDDAGATVAGSERDDGATEAEAVGADADADVDAETETGSPPADDAAADDAADAASTGSTVDTEAAADDADVAAEPAEATDPGETGPTETVADEPEPDASSEAAASGGASSAASTGSTVDAGDGAAEPAEATDPAGTTDDGLGDFDAGDPGADSNDAAADADFDGEEGMYELDEDERREVEDEFGTEFSTGNEVDEPGEADIDVPDAEDVEELTGGEDGGDPASAGAGSAASTDSTVDAAAAADDADAAAEPAEATDPAGATDDDLGDFDTGDADTDTGADADADADVDAEAGGSEAEASAGDGDGASAAGGDAPDAADVDLESTAVDVMEELDDGDGADRERVVAALVERYGADPGDAEDAIQDALMSGKCYEPGEGQLKAI
jgi:hypothetical protein